jgi:hypothetical protein
MRLQLRLNVIENLAEMKFYSRTNLTVAVVKAQKVRKKPTT